jgi:2-polyprenyl-6-methoxyphenol hydroxylase-like FAD-dependent oxidoreductase
VRTRSAIVVGGGIGGLATAGALARAGWQVTVYEQAPAFGAVGAGVGLTPNGLRALDWLGVGDQLRARGMVQGVVGIRSASGRWILRVEAAEAERRFGGSMYAIHRADLHEILLGTTRDARLHTGHRARSVTTGQDTASVTFDGPDGPVTDTADLVVAADGVHSRLRSELFPSYPGVRYVGVVVWRGVVPADRVEQLPLESALTETWGRGLRFGTALLGDGRLYWFCGQSAPEGSYRNDGLEQVAARFSAWHQPIPQALAATPPDALIRNDIYNMHAKLPSFIRGRVVLLGDAAHAVSPDIGQGASLALEDAVVLAATIADAEPSDTDLDRRLAAFDRMRRPRTEKMARNSGRAAHILQARSRPAAWLRDAIATALPKQVFLGAMGSAISWSPPEPVPAARR